MLFCKKREQVNLSIYRAVVLTEASPTPELPVAAVKLCRSTFIKLQTTEILRIIVSVVTRENHP